MASAVPAMSAAADIDALVARAAARGVHVTREQAARMRNDVQAFLARPGAPTPPPAPAPAAVSTPPAARPSFLSSQLNPTARAALLARGVTLFSPSSGTSPTDTPTSVEEQTRTPALTRPSLEAIAPAASERLRAARRARHMAESAASAADSPNATKDAYAAAALLPPPAVDATMTPSGADETLAETPHPMSKIAETPLPGDTTIKPRMPATETRPWVSPGGTLNLALVSVTAPGDTTVDLGIDPSDEEEDGDESFSATARKRRRLRIARTGHLMEATPSRASSRSHLMPSALNDDGDETGIFFEHLQADDALPAVAEVSEHASDMSSEPDVSVRMSIVTTPAQQLSPEASFDGNQNPRTSFLDRVMSLKKSPVRLRKQSHAIARAQEAWRLQQAQYLAWTTSMTAHAQQHGVTPTGVPGFLPVGWSGVHGLSTNIPLPLGAYESQPEEAEDETLEVPPPPGTLPSATPLLVNSTPLHGADETMASPLAPTPTSNTALFFDTSAQGVAFVSAMLEDDARMAEPLHVDFSTRLTADVEMPKPYRAALTLGLPPRPPPPPPPPLKQVARSSPETPASRPKKVPQAPTRLKPIPGIAPPKGGGGLRTCFYLDAPLAQRVPAVDRLVLPAAGLCSAPEWDLPGGARLIQLIAEDANRNDLSELVARYMILPSGWGASEARPRGTSYAGLIGQALRSSSDGVLSLAEINLFIVACYPFYIPGDRKWMNSIRHNLSLHRSFAKRPRPREIPGKGGLWTIVPGHEDCFIDGACIVPATADVTSGPIAGAPEASGEEPPSPSKSKATLLSPASVPAPGSSAKRAPSALEKAPAGRKRRRPAQEVQLSGSALTTPMEDVQGEDVKPKLPSVTPARGRAAASPPVADDSDHELEMDEPIVHTRTKPRLALYAGEEGAEGETVVDGELADGYEMWTPLYVTPRDNRRPVQAGANALTPSLYAFGSPFRGRLGGPNLGLSSRTNTLPGAGLGGSPTRSGPSPDRFAGAFSRIPYPYASVGVGQGSDVFNSSPQGPGTDSPPDTRALESNQVVTRSPLTTTRSPLSATRSPLSNIRGSQPAPSPLGRRQPRAGAMLSAIVEAPSGPSGGPLNVLGTPGQGLRGSPARLLTPASRWLRDSPRRAIPSSTPRPAVPSALGSAPSAPLAEDLFTLTTPSRVEPGLGSEADLSFSPWQFSFMSPARVDGVMSSTPHPAMQRSLSKRSNATPSRPREPAQTLAMQNHMQSLDRWGLLSPRPSPAEGGSSMEKASPSASLEDPFEFAPRDGKEGKQRSPRRAPPPLTSHGGSPLKRVLASVEECDANEDAGSV